MVKSFKNVTFISLLKDNEDDTDLLVNYLKKKISILIISFLMEAKRVKKNYLKI